MFYDVERVNGGEKSQPFSVGLVAMKSGSGKVLKKKEIFVMPDNVKDMDWFGTKRLHRMYVDVKDDVKTMMYRPWDKRKKPSELPSVSVKVAAKQVVKFMNEEPHRRHRQQAD